MPFTHLLMVAQESVPGGGPTTPGRSDAGFGRGESGLSTCEFFFFSIVGSGQDINVDGGRRNRAQGPHGQ